MKKAKHKKTQSFTLFSQGLWGTLSCVKSEMKNGGYGFDYLLVILIQTLITRGTVIILNHKWQI